MKNAYAISQKCNWNISEMQLQPLVRGSFMTIARLKRLCGTYRNAFATSGAETSPGLPFYSACIAHISETPLQSRAQWQHETCACTAPPSRTCRKCLRNLLHVGFMTIALSQCLLRAHIDNAFAIRRLVAACFTAAIVNCCCCCGTVPATLQF